MNLLLLVLAAALGALAALRPPREALAVLVGTVVLVPGSLTLPAVPGVLTLHRWVLLAAAAGLVRQCRRGRLPWEVLRPPALAAKLLLVVGLVGVLGVGLLEPTTNAAAAARNWQALAAQLPFLLVWVALVRACGDLVDAAVVVVGATLLSGVVALGEAATGHSYARAWFHLLPSELGSDQAQVLAVRGGRVRVRAAADFTLAFAWVTAAVVPLLLVLASARRRLARPLLVVGLPLLVGAVVLTYSRTVVLPMLLVVVLVAVALRDRAIRLAAAGIVAAAGVALFTSTTLSNQFTADVDTGSIDVRVDRLPVIGDLVAAHPWKGLGISGLASQGIPVTDSSYLLAYAEVGVLGLAVLTAVLLAAVGEAGLGAWRAAGSERLVAAGATLGLLVLLAGTFTFDTFSVPAAAETFWLLAALGLVAQDGTRRPWRLSARSRAGAVLAGLAVGVVLRLAAPAHVAQTWQFEALLPYPATAQAATYTGSQLRGTFCAVATAVVTAGPVTCQSAGDAPGQGVLRLQAGTVAELRAQQAELLQVAARARPLSRLRLQERGPVVTGVPTGLRTAPGWLPLLVAVWVLPVPGRRAHEGSH